MKHRTFWRRFFLVAALATAALIFFFSAQQGPESAELSDGVTLQVAKIVKPDYARQAPQARQAFLERLSAIVRKCAHFSEFALLAFNLAAYWRLRRWEKPRRAALPPAWLAATLYAASDELHQRFVSDRAPALLDVGIDSAGALTGALVALLIMALARRIRFK